jgi:hypothetical protein
MTDREKRAQQACIRLPAGKRRVDAAEPIQSNLLRFVHELQTAVDGSVRAAVIALGAYGVSRRRFGCSIAAGTSAAWSVPVALFL